MPVIYSNNASTSLSSGINDSTTTIPIASASGFPSIGVGEYYFATIANTANTKIEVVKVTAGTTSLTVLRAQGGTSAQAFDSGDNFQLRVTADTLEAATVTDVNITGGAIATAAITDDAVTADKLANSINTDIATGVTGNTTANAALPKAGGAMTGAITTNSTFDGRDVATDGTKLDGIEASADVTDTTNVTSAGALMDSELAGIAAVKATTGTFLSADESKLDGIEASATADQSAGEILTLIEDGVDSVHYVDGSIDLVHMSSESVDEDNIYISNAGSNGQFLSKQSGNNGGLTWATVSSEDFIPDGSVMCFFQSGAPTGWTKLATQNDKVLRVVSGTGGGTGGDWALTAGETSSSDGAHAHTSAAHTHTGAAHTHTGAAHTHGGGSLAAGAHTLSISEMPTHGHPFRVHPGGSNGGNSGGLTSDSSIHGAHLAPQTSTQGPYTGGASDSVMIGGQGSSSSHSHSLSGTSASTTPGAGGSTTPGASGSTTPGDTGSAGAHTHTIAAPQYIDVIICSKDA